MPHLPMITFNGAVHDGGAILQTYWRLILGTSNEDWNTETAVHD
jgi:hypothetical protein